MMHSIILTALLTIAFPVVAMDDGQAPAAAEGNDEATVVEMALHSTPSYIGKSNRRALIEAQYGTTLPLNTIFVWISIKSAEGYRALYAVGKFDGIIPYEYIKDVQEGGSTKVVTVHGRKFIFQCNQLGANWCGENRFEDLLAGCLDRFSKRADWECDGGEDSLVKDNVVNKENKTWHGKNCSPFVKEGK